jgi:hypothetical protein
MFGNLSRPWYAHSTKMASELPIPADLPFLEGLSWFDAEFRRLDPLDTLKRYESGSLAHPIHSLTE